MSDQDPFDPDHAATVSAELVMVIAQAVSMVEEGESGHPLRELLTHARDLYDILMDQLTAAEPGDMEYARGLADALGNKLEDLEELLAQGPASSH